MSKTTLFDVFRTSSLNDPTASRKQAFELFLDEVKGDPRLVRALAEDYFYRMAAQWEPQKVGKSFMLAATPATKRRAEMSAERREESAARVNKSVADLKVRIKAVIMLDLVMPNGKKLRHCTGAEVAKFGGMFTEIARHIKPTQVIDKHFNERDLQEIKLRYIGTRRQEIERRANA